MRGFNFLCASVLMCSELQTAAARAESEPCRPGASCESTARNVAGPAQAPTQGSGAAATSLYANLGVGTPYGVLGLSLAVAPERWLALEVGVGVNPDEGAEVGFAPRLRLPLSAELYLTLGSGISWARRYVGHADPLGELIAEHRVALPVWAPAYFWNTELGVELNHGHFAARVYPGYAKVINASSFTCSEGQACDPGRASSLVYFGTAFGYTF
jgi:hypothetical protein